MTKKELMKKIEKALEVDGCTFELLASGDVNICHKCECGRKDCDFCSGTYKNIRAVGKLIFGDCKITKE